MVLRNSGNSPIEIFERLSDKSAGLSGDNSKDWPEPVAQHWPETVAQQSPGTSLEIRLLQARIAALDPDEDEDVLELSDEAA